MARPASGTGHPARSPKLRHGKCRRMAMGRVMTARFTTVTAAMAFNRLHGEAVSAERKSDR
ncbi:hypothetical protein KCP73_21625 [Salmonella enterica subsp. enterica]|nr:hypothetical protein KCP73_21625 [Salmonella enterica subsp. enterica]